MKKHAKNTLLIFLKYPKPGSVKTRLAKSIGKKKAALLYKSFAETILQNTKDKRYKSVVCFAPENRKKDIEKWLGEDVELRPQKGKDLGERLAAAFKDAFKSGAKKVTVIGTDSPLLDSKIVAKSFDGLSKKKAVIGPSMDGGYYLLGLSRFYARIFKDVGWGTDKVFIQTLSNMRKTKLECELLERHFDVDSKEDLILLKNIIKERRKHG